MDLSLIILNYVSKAKLINCLVSIRVADFSDLSYEIIVVDNHSHDDLSNLNQI